MHGQHHGGKGSAKRAVNSEQFNNNFDAIFRKRKEPQPEGYCGRCDALKYEGECYTKQEQESYDIGDRTVWETVFWIHCDICNETLDDVA